MNTGLKNLYYQIYKGNLLQEDRAYKTYARFFSFKNNDRVPGLAFTKKQTVRRLLDLNHFA